MPDYLREAIKILVCFMGYLAVAPALGISAAFKPAIRPILLASIFACSALPPTWFTLTIFNIDGYRGHVRGWQCSIAEILGLALLIEAFITRRDLLGRSLWLTLPFALYVFLCSLSLFSSWDPAFTGMAIFKYSKALLILGGAFCAIREAKDIRIALWVMGFALGMQLGVGLWQRYVEHVWRVRAFFEHSNPMAMWAYCTGIVVFASALRPGVHLATSLHWLLASASSAALVILSLARASLAALAAGIAAAIVGTALFARSVRLLAIASWITVAAILMLSVSYDSLQERIERAAEAEDEGDLRPILEEQAAAMLADHVFGVGWNNYCIANSRPRGDQYSEILEEWDRRRGHRIVDDMYQSNPMTENLWWLHLAECGYAGLTGLLIFMAWTMGYAIRAFWRHRNSMLGGTALGILIMFSISYPHGFYERILMEPKNLTAWMLFAALAARLCRIHPVLVDDPPLLTARVKVR